MRPKVATQLNLNIGYDCSDYHSLDGNVNDQKPRLSLLRVKQLPTQLHIIFLLPSLMSVVSSPP